MKTALNTYSKESFVHYKMPFIGIIEVSAIMLNALVSYWLRFWNIPSVVSCGEWCLMLPLGSGNFAWRVQRTGESGSFINELLYHIQNCPASRTLHFSHVR
jgi:hypothetical protein